MPYPTHRVSTLEAMAALLRELEEPEETAAALQEGMLLNCKIKVGKVGIEDGCKDWRGDGWEDGWGNWCGRWCVGDVR